MARKIRITPRIAVGRDAHGFSAELRKRYERRLPEDFDYSIDYFDRVRIGGKRLYDRWSSGLVAIPDRVEKSTRAALEALDRHGAELRGPSTVDEIDQLFAQLHEESPWMERATKMAWLAARENAAAGAVGLRMPPILILGAHGAGKTWLAERLSAIAGVPLRRIDGAAGATGWRITGLERGWGNGEQGVVVDEMIRSRCANPLILIDELDKAPTHRRNDGPSSLQEALLQVLEPSTAGTFECAFLRMRVDLTHVNWVLTGNDSDMVRPEIKSRCRIVKIPKLGPREVTLILSKVGLDEDEIEQFLRVFERDIHHGRVTARHLFRLAPGGESYLPTLYN